jgi:hypothetical protein
MDSRMQEIALTSHIPLRSHYTPAKHQAFARCLANRPVPAELTDELTILQLDTPRYNALAPTPAHD